MTAPLPRNVLQAAEAIPAGSGAARLAGIILAGLVLVGLTVGLLDWTGTDYAYLAAYTVLQFVVLATAWNILGGYAGYVNFGTAAFFAIGCYTTVVIYKTIQLPLLLAIPIGGLMAGIVGFGTG